jgi:hypothetical protein
MTTVSSDENPLPDTETVVLMPADTLLGERVITGVLAGVGVRVGVAVEVGVTVGVTVTVDA